MIPSPVLGGQPQRVLAVHVQQLREGDTGGRFSEQLLETLAALDVRQAAQVLAVLPQDVEEDQPLVASLLEQLKARRALLVQHDHLAVDDELLLLDLLNRGEGLWKARTEIELVAAEDRRLAAGDADHAAEAVVLHLEHPVAAAGGRLRERGEHRRKDFLEQLLGRHCTPVITSGAITRTSSNPSLNEGGTSLRAVT